MKLSYAFFSQIMTSFILLSCSGKTVQGAKCSSVKALVSQRVLDDRRLPDFMRKYDAAGGELFVEFRKDDILGSPAHQKRCAFYLEPHQASASGGIFWTAGHCLDASRDSRYRLRFYIDVPTGYVEIPIVTDQLTQLQKFRELISKTLSPSLQTEVLSALNQREVDYSESKNARDICLESMKSGRTFWHEPMPGMNQVTCFLYQDLRMVEFRFPSDLSQVQKNVVNFMIDRAKKFDEANIISRAATITDGSKTEQTAVFRETWLNSYKEYVEYRESENFKGWFENNRQSCSTAGVAESSEICEKLVEVQRALAEAGLSTHSKFVADESEESFATGYLDRKRKIVELWKFFTRSVVSIDGVESRTWDELELLTNYSHSSGLKTFSSLSPGSFIGLGWGSTIDEGGKSRDRVGGATYNWTSAVDEMFFYFIFPKNQSTENLQLGYGQLQLSAGDSGSVLLAGGLPMAVLATVDGEKTSGGASVLPLPSPVAEEDSPTAGDPVVTAVSTVSSAGGISSPAQACR